MCYVEKFQPCLLVCDELDRLGPTLDQKKSAAYAVINFGAAAGVDVFGSARAPQNIDKGWLAQADDLVLFHLTTVQTLRQLRQFGTQEAEQAAEIVPRLPRFKYIVLKQ
jgi:hypothetical protein